MDGFVKVATTADIPVGTFKSIEIDFDRMVLVHTEDGFFCLADECSHDSEPISTGLLKSNELICSRHGARFDVRTGDVTRAPAIVGIDSYEVRVDGDDIYVKLGLR